MRIGRLLVEWRPFGDLWALIPTILIGRTGKDPYGYSIGIGWLAWSARLTVIGR